MEGNKVYRHKQNPEEKLFHDKFIEMHPNNNTLSGIVFEPNLRGTYPSEYLDEKGEKIVITTVQWLGSPIGQNFLRVMGYEKK